MLLFSTMLFIEKFQRFTIQMRFCLNKKQMFQMQRAEMEELRQREANLTALQAIGPRKKPKLDTAGSTSSGSTSGANASTSGLNRQMPMRPRVKRVNYRDLLFLFEQEKDTCRSTTLYKSYLK